MSVKPFVAIFALLVLILYGIHDYLYLPNVAFDAMSFHLEKICKAMIGMHMISRPFYEQTYDKIHILSMHSFIFAWFWTSIIFMSIGSIIGYGFLIIYAKEFDNKLFFNILLYARFFLVIYITILCYVISIYTPRYLKAYFLVPFQLDLQLSKHYYNLVSDRLHEEFLLLLWQVWIISKWIYIGLSALYLLFHIGRVCKKKISSKKLQQREKTRQEREAWLDADNNIIIQELKEHESTEHKNQLARQQAKEKVAQEQIQAMKEAKLSQIRAQKLTEEHTRIQLENAISQNKVPTD